MAAQTVIFDVNVTYTSEPDFAMSVYLMSTNYANLTGACK